MRFLLIAAVAALAGCGASQAEGPKEYGYQVVRSYPHDANAYTQGLLYHTDGYLYEGTGREGHSSIRKVKLETGEVVQKRDIPRDYFGEGIVIWKDKLLELTWQAQAGFIFDAVTFAPRGEYQYPGEGWGLTHNGKEIIMSDGTAQIRFWDPETLRELRRITVTDNGQPVLRLNELEWVKGEIYANIWETDRIARIDPKNGRVLGWIDLSGILTAADRATKNGEGEEPEVLNGIAYDATRDRLFITGKWWPKLFEIKLVEKR